MMQFQKETGLWLTSKDHEDELESIILSSKGKQETDAGFFLHGICGVFALALHDQFGYHIEWSLDDEEDETDKEEYEDSDIQEYDPWAHLIHIYCLDDSQQLFIDIRGITQDEKRFFEPFEDFFTELSYYAPCEDDSHELRGKLIETMGEEALKFYYDCAGRMIEMHPDWYSIP